MNEKYVKTETMQPTVGTTGSQNRAENPRCATCGAVATCFGAYDGEAEAYACDGCCRHGGEDGYCLPVEASSGKYSKTSEGTKSAESCSNSRQTEKSAAKYSEKYSEPPSVDLQPWKRQRCKVCPANCVREDGHHGQHRDAAGNLWDYGHCAQDPLVTDCERCREDEHPIAGRKTTAPRMRCRKPEQLSLF